MSLKRRVMQYINKFGIILDIDYKRADPQTLFDALIKTIGLGNNVLLIDEYDYPLVHIPSTLTSKSSTPTPNYTTLFTKQHRSQCLQTLKLAICDRYSGKYPVSVPKTKSYNYLIT